MNQLFGINTGPDLFGDREALEEGSNNRANKKQPF